MSDYTYDKETGTLTLYSSITTTESLGRLNPVHVCFAGGNWSGKDDIINNILKIVCKENGRLESCKLPDGLTKIDDVAFYHCFGLTSITIPNSVTKIGNSAFEYCTVLTSVTIPESVTEIGDRAFYSCKKLTSITIPNSVTKIGNGAFCECENLTSITIPNSVTKIADFTFSDCRALRGVVIPESVETIGCGAFSRCFGLTSVAIPGSVKKIHVSIFDNCVGLTKITFCGDVNMGAWDDTYFNSVPGLQTIEVCSERMKNRLRDHLERRDVSVVVSQNTQTNPKGSVPCRKTPPVIPPYNNRGR